MSLPIHSTDRDTHIAPNFYATPLGQMAAAAVSARLGQLWPDLTGQTVLGIGYPAPFLKRWDAQAYACLNATTSHHEPPPPGACAAEATQLPFPDMVFDRILVIHGVEPVGQDSRLLREIWRILKDDGRIMIVAPNRTGLWAHVDSTPFGQGQPYSPSQINRLLASGMFRAERRETALFTPPARLAVRFTRLCETVGHALAPELAGVTLTEAVKDAYAGLPVTARVTRRVLVPEGV